MSSCNFLLFVALFVLHAAFAFAAGASSRPNVVLIYTDDQGYGDMSALNPRSKFQTPHMDRLAREGLVFTDGHCADTVCTPSRYALLTGRYAWRTSLKSGVLHAEDPCLIEKGRLTIASLLEAQGYHTAMFGKWHLGMEVPGEVGQRDWSQPIADGPNAHGFTTFYGIPASMNYGVLTFIENTRVTDPPSVWTRKKPEPKNGTFRFMPPYENAPQGDADIEIAPSFRDDICLGRFTEKTVKYIDRVASEAKAGKPFFVYFALNSPHLPHSPAREFVGRSAIGTYGDFMMETDHRVGEVLAALDRNGLAENTLVILSSDNGSESNYVERLQRYGHASNGDLKGGKRDIYEGGHRVPFVARWPAVIAKGRQFSEPVCQTDIIATLADILGVKMPANAAEDSFSLMPAFRGTPSPSTSRAVIHHSGSGHFAIREGRWKLNLFRGSGGSLAPKQITPKGKEPPFELYDMQTDWRETTNVHDKHPEVVARLRLAAARIVRQGRSTPGAAQSNDESQPWPQLAWLPAKP